MSFGSKVSSWAVSVVLTLAVSLLSPVAVALDCNGMKVKSVATKLDIVVVIFEPGVGDSATCPAAYHHAAVADVESTLALLLTAKATDTPVGINYSSGGSPIQGLIPNHTPNVWAREIVLIQLD